MKVFEFIKEVRNMRKTHVNATEDAGEYMNKLQIARELGGVDHPEAMAQAEFYINTCEKIGGKFKSHNSWTGASNYLFIKRLTST
eukprot:1295890-Karenia_brevis.AAC.1